MLWLDVARNLAVTVGMLCLGAVGVQTSAVAALLRKCPTATI